MWNLFDNPGLNGGHADWVQLSGATSITATCIVDFNTVVQQTSAGSQGFGLFPGTSGTFNSSLLECSNNTMMSYTSVAQPSYFYSSYFSGSVITGGGTMGTVGTVNVQNNFVDPSGTLANGGNRLGFQQHGTQGTAIFNYCGNIDMRNGNTIAVNT